MIANTTSSRKAKGRLLQQWVRDMIVNTFNLQVDDVISTSMGCGGEDVKLSPLARSKFPFSVECKNVEKLNFWSAYDQAIANSQQKYQPLLVVKKARRKPVVLLDAEYFFKLLRRLSHD